MSRIKNEMENYKNEDDMEHDFDEYMYNLQQQREYERECQEPSFLQRCREANRKLKEAIKGAVNRDKGISNPTS